MFLMPAIAIDAESIVRIGITDNNFQNVMRQQVVVFGTSECEICDKHSKKIILKVMIFQRMNSR